MEPMEDKQTRFRVPSLLAEERNLGLAILRVGHSNVHRSYRRYAYHKAAYTLKIIARGSGVIRTSEGDHAMQTGDVVLFWQGNAYEWWTDPQNLLEHFWVDLEGAAIPDMFGLLANPADCVLKRDALPKNEVALFSQLLDLYRNHPPHYVWKSLAIFFELWHSITETTLCERLNLHTPAHNAKAFIDAHYMVDISIADVAGYAGVTPQYLAVIFKKRYGITPIEYILNCRLQTAARLMREGYSVRNAAAAVGYNDPNYFSRLFHKRMKVAPGSIIRQNRK